MAVTVFNPYQQQQPQQHPFAQPFQPVVPASAGIDPNATARAVAAGFANGYGPDPKKDPNAPLDISAAANADPLTRIQMKLAQLFGGNDQPANPAGPTGLY